MDGGHQEKSVLGLAHHVSGVAGGAETGRDKVVKGMKLKDLPGRKQRAGEPPLDGRETPRDQSVDYLNTAKAKRKETTRPSPNSPGFHPKSRKSRTARLGNP